MKFVKRLVVLLCLSICVYANSHCDKNAWIGWKVDGASDGVYGLDLKVYSGKGANDITSDIVQRALMECANNDFQCWGNIETGYYCTQNGRRVKNGDHGWGNIEFWCTDGLYTCYDFDWYYN